MAGMAAGMAADIAAGGIPAGGAEIPGAVVVVVAIKLASNLYSVQKELTGLALWVLFKYSLGSYYIKTTYFHTLSLYDRM